MCFSMAPCFPPKPDAIRKPWTSSQVFQSPWFVIIMTCVLLQIPSASGQETGAPKEPGSDHLPLLLTASPLHLCHRSHHHSSAQEPHDRCQGCCDRHHYCSKSCQVRAKSFKRHTKHFVQRYSSEACVAETSIIYLLILRKVSECFYLLHRCIGGLK